MFYRTKKIILVLQNKKDTEAIDRDERIEMNSQIHHRSSLSIGFKGTCSSSIILLLALFTIALGFQPSLKRHLRLQQFINIPKYQFGSTKYQFSRRVLFSSNEDYEYDEAPGALIDEDLDFSREELERLTMTQLKQQLRLRGMKVSGKKSELIMRLMGNRRGYTEDTEIVEPEVTNKSTTTKSKAQKFAESRGKELVDISEYLDEDEKGKETKSSLNDEDKSSDNVDTNKSVSPETWGEEAKIVDDFEGRSIIVDNLSRTIVEFKGSGSTKAQAYVVASRESLKTFLAGGDRGNNSTDVSTAVRNIQLAREKASKVPIRLEDQQGEDSDDEEGLYSQILDRDYGDYGDYSVTGAQLSAQEVKGVLLLSDVMGPFNDDTKVLCEKIAFECQPVVVFAPDLFRGNPWQEVSNTGLNAKGENYEEWRASHPEQRVSVDIRAAASVLKEQYGVSSISLFGQCYGGGRALEATARSYPYDTLDDINGEMGPPHGKS